MTYPARPGANGLGRFLARIGRTRRVRYAAIGAVLAIAVPGFAATSGALTPLTSRGAVTGTISLKAYADAYVMQEAPYHNAAAVPSLFASNQAGHGRRLYIKFRVTGIPAGATIEHADLVVHAWHPLPTTLQVNRDRSATWEERRLTDRNAPSRSMPSVVARVAPRSRSATIDVRRLVSGNGYVSVSVAPQSRGWLVDLISREGGSSGPQLRLSWRRVRQLPLINPLPLPITTSPPASPAPTDSPSPSSSTTPSTCTVSALLVPSCGVWWGAVSAPTAGQSYDQAFTALEAKLGRPFDIDHYYLKDDQHFPSQALIDRAHEPGKHRLLLLNWKPATDHTWAQVAAGAVDARIDSEAAYLKTHFTEKFFLVIWHEPENDVIPSAGSGMTASDYAAMWRHVVLRLRGDGVSNAVTVICYEATPEWASKSWWPQLWPGSDVVDWMGEDAYTVGAGKIWGGNFAQTMNRTDPQFPNWPGFYTWAQRTAPAKPIMIPEYGVQDVVGDPTHKPTFFNTEAAGLSQLPAIKAVVYWNNPGQPDAIDSSQASLDAFRQLGQNAMVNPQTAFGERFS